MNIPRPSANGGELWKTVVAVLLAAFLSLAATTLTIGRSTPDRDEVHQMIDRETAAINDMDNRLRLVENDVAAIRAILEDRR